MQVFYETKGCFFLDHKKIHPSRISVTRLNYWPQGGGGGDSGFPSGDNDQRAERRRAFRGDFGPIAGIFGNQNAILASSRGFFIFIG